MSEMKERAVRAITEEFESGRRVFNDGEAEALVRVVMKAMREPTQAMIAKGREQTCEHGDMQCGCDESWRAMIDEALR